MDEKDWLTCFSSQRMVRYLEICGWDKNWLYHPGTKWMNRKLRLYLCAFWRLQSIPDGVEPFHRFYNKTATKAEKLADEDSDTTDRLKTIEDACYPLRNDCEKAASEISIENTVAAECQAGLLREIFGNQFRPLSLCGKWQSIRESYKAHYWDKCENCEIIRTKSVVGIAQAIYKQHDHALLPILKDALIDAGCANQAVLQHCDDMELCPDCCGRKVTRCLGRCANGWIKLRGAHWRGCWLIDLILKK